MSPDLYPSCIYSQKLCIYCMHAAIHGSLRNNIMYILSKKEILCIILLADDLR